MNNDNNNFNNNLNNNLNNNYSNLNNGQLNINQSNNNLYNQYNNGNVGFQQLGNPTSQQQVNFNNNYGYYNPTLNNQNSVINKNKTNKIIIFVIAFVVFLALIIFFAGGILDSFFGIKNPKESHRTIMIYMVGADLESQNGLASHDLNSIDYSKMDNENLNVVLMAGGSKKWKNSYINSNETSIYELTSNGFEKVKKQKSKSMGSANSLIDFLNYSVENYESDKYDLIFWNHGGAIQGSEYDELYFNDYLSLNELKTALANSKFNDNNKLETIIFRTCLNGTIEVADTLKDYADYLVASEEVTLGSTDISQTALEFINDIEKDDEGYDVSLKFVNGYKDFIESMVDEYCYGFSSCIYSTYSIMDLSKTQELVKLVNDFFSDVSVYNNYDEIARIRSNMYQYSNDVSGYDMIDLYTLIQKLKYLSPTKAEKILTNIDNMVVYNYASDNNSKGISIYFPYNGSSQEKQVMLNIYNNLSNFKAYNTFINDFYKEQKSSNYKFSFANNITNINKNDNTSNSDFELELTDEQKAGFARAEYLVFRDNKDGYFLPVYNGSQVSLNGNTLSANIRDRQLKVKSEIDNSENIINLHEKEENDEYISYEVSVVLENFSNEETSKMIMDAAKATIVYNKNTKKVDIGNIILNSSDDSLPNVAGADLKDYEYIVFAGSSYKILDENGNYIEDWESNGIIKGFEGKIDEINIELQNYDDGYDYYCVFRIYDTNNNYYYSKLVKMN